MPSVEKGDSTRRQDVNVMEVTGSNSNIEEFVDCWHSRTVLVQLVKGDFGAVGLQDVLPHACVVRLVVLCSNHEWRVSYFDAAFP